jgi:hypothetical protein
MEKAEMWVLHQISKGITTDVTPKEYLASFFVWETCLHIGRLIEEGKRMGKPMYESAEDGGNSMTSIYWIERRRHRESAAQLLCKQSSGVALLPISSWHMKALY